MFTRTTEITKQPPPLSESPPNYRFPWFAIAMLVAGVVGVSAGAIGLCAHRGMALGVFNGLEKLQELKEGASIALLTCSALLVTWSTLGLIIYCKSKQEQHKSSFAV